MRKFLLVHGGSHGAWCWERLILELVARGHEAYAFDLPGHGSDLTPRNHITRQTYIQAVCQYLEGNKSGHSPMLSCPVELANLLLSK